MQALVYVTWLVTCCINPNVGRYETLENVSPTFLPIHHGNDTQLHNDFMLFSLDVNWRPDCFIGMLKTY